jgi:hypothetical protein
MVLGGVGLAVSTGLNAYLPLLIIALADRMGSAVDLKSPFDWLSSPAGIIVLMLILPLELIGDKVPRLDRYNDLVHSVIRPLAGAMAFAAIASQDDFLNPWLAAGLGLIVAALVHAWKMRSRAAVSSATAGLGSPFASVLEDAVVIAVSLCSVFLPWANLAAVPLGLAALQRSYRRMSTGESRTIRAFQPRTRT